MTVSSSVQTATLKPTSFGGYQGFQTDAAKMWQADEMVVFSATGNVVGSFQVALQAPDHLLVSQPPWSTGQAPTIPRDQPLALAWSGKSAGDAEFIIQGPNEVGQSEFRGARCRFPAKDGKGEVPAAVLKEFSAGSKCIISLSSVSDAVVTVSDYGSIAVRAEMCALAANQANQYAMSVVLQ